MGIINQRREPRREQRPPEPAARRWARAMGRGILHALPMLSEEDLRPYGASAAAAPSHGRPSSSCSCSSSFSSRPLHSGVCSPRAAPHLQRDYISRGTPTSSSSSSSCYRCPGIAADRARVAAGSPGSPPCPGPQRPCPPPTRYGLRVSPERWRARRASLGGCFLLGLGMCAACWVDSPRSCFGVSGCRVPPTPSSAKGTPHRSRRPSLGAGRWEAKRCPRGGRGCVFKSFPALALGKVP